jgi:putative ABC transport system permease protein
MIFKIFKISFKNIFSYWKANAGALFSIALAFFTLCLFRGYVEDILNVFSEIIATKNMYGHVILEKSGSSVKNLIESSVYLNSAEQEWIDRYLSQSPLVKRRVRFLNVSGMITSGHRITPFSGFGYDLADGAAMRNSWAWDTLAGIPLDLSPDESVVTGKSLAHILECTALKNEPFVKGLDGYVAKDRPFSCTNDHFRLSSTTVDGRSNAIDLTLVGMIDGVFKEVDSRLLMISIPQAQALLNTNHIDRYSVELKEPLAAKVFLSDFLNQSAKASFNFTAVRWQDHKLGEPAMIVLEWMRHVEIFIILILLGIVGLSVSSTIYRNIKERTSETGTLRCLGFQRPHIILLFLSETFFLSILGCFLGLLLLFMVVNIINHSELYYQTALLSDKVPLSIPIAIGTLASTFLALTFLAWFSTIIPALQLAYKNIPDCLGNLE